MTERITAYALMEQFNIQNNIQKQKWIFTLRMDHSHCDAALLRTAVFRILLVLTALIVILTATGDLNRAADYFPLLPTGSTTPACRWRC